MELYSVEQIINEEVPESNTYNLENYKYSLLNLDRESIINSPIIKLLLDELDYQECSEEIDPYYLYLINRNNITEASKFGPIVVLCEFNARPFHYRRVYPAKNIFEMYKLLSNAFLMMVRLYFTSKGTLKIYNDNNPYFRINNKSKIKYVFMGDRIFKLPESYLESIFNIKLVCNEYKNLEAKFDINNLFKTQGVKACI